MNVHSKRLCDMKIVRRKMKQGGTIGRYIVITRENKQGVFARYVGEKAEQSEDPDPVMTDDES